MIPLDSCKRARSTARSAELPSLRPPLRPVAGARRRRFGPSTAGLLLASVGLASSAHGGALWSWNAGDGFWMTASNWLPSSVPGVDVFQSYNIHIGDLPGVQNSTVLLNHPVGSGALTFDALAISDGMTLDMNGREIGGLTGEVTVSGTGSTLIVRSSLGLNFHDFTAAEMTVGSGALFQFADNGRARTFTLTNAGVLSGQGTLHIEGGGPGAAFVNNGMVLGGVNGGLVVSQDGAGRLDLDGTFGDGQVQITTPFAQLTFEGDTLADAFDGTMTLGSGALLNMNMSDGWTVGAGGTFNVASAVAGGAVQIAGGDLTFGGALNVGGSQGHIRFLADTTMASSADVFLGDNDRVEFDGAASIEGGVYDLSGGARIDFDGPTEIGGGTFNLAGNTVSQGVINLNGATVWSGSTATINGVARQFGDASVGTPTTINAAILDMDGNNSTTWTINHGLTVNAGAIELGSQQFDGTFNLNTGAIGRLTLNLNDPGASWTMSGTMNLAGFAALTTTRVAGSRMIVTGDLNMGSGIAQITADTAFQGAGVSIAAGGTLRVFGATTVDAATSFSGSGTFHNASDGNMLFRTGVSLGQAALNNSGRFQIGEDAPGIAAVDRFDNNATARWTVEIGGYTPGGEHDALLVTGGTAHVDGRLLVELIRLGPGPLFAPVIGDEFTVLTALGGVSGNFLNQPTTSVGDLTYRWTILYNPNSVVLRLDSVVPSPGSAVLFGAGGLLMARRRCRRSPLAR